VHLIQIFEVHVKLVVVMVLLEEDNVVIVMVLVDLADFVEENIIILAQLVKVEGK